LTEDAAQRVHNLRASVEAGIQIINNALGKYDQNSQLSVRYNKDYFLDALWYLVAVVKLVFLLFTQYRFLNY
jgi:hypothetical protein